MNKEAFIIGYLEKLGNFMDLLWDKPKFQFVNRLPVMDSQTREDHYNLRDFKFKMDHEAVARTKEMLRRYEILSPVATRKPTFVNTDNVSIPLSTQSPHMELSPYLQPGDASISMTIPPSPLRHGIVFNATTRQGIDNVIPHELGHSMHFNRGAEVRLDRSNDLRDEYGADIGARELLGLEDNADRQQFAAKALSTYRIPEQIVAGFPYNYSTSTNAIPRFEKVQAKAFNDLAKNWHNWTNTHPQTNVWQMPPKSSVGPSSTNTLPSTAPIKPVKLNL